MSRARSRPAAALLSTVAALALAPVASAAGPEGGIDDRGWELVSPVEKNGGEVALPGGPGEGVFQAAAQGSGFTYASPASFGAAAGAPPLSQYVARRGPGGWVSENLSPAQLAGAYAGDPYLAFAADLGSSLYLSPSVCAAGDPCLPGYRLRDGGGALVLSPPDPGAFAGATPGLGRIVFLDGTDLLLWAPPSDTLTPVNDAPAAGLGGDGAVSSDGSRIYWQGVDGNLYLREGGGSAQVDEAVGGGGSFEAASADGGIAFFSKAGHLYRYDAVTEGVADLLPSGDLVDVLGASADGARLFYRAAAGVYSWRPGLGGQLILGAGQASDLSAASGGISADGSRLFFTTAGSLILADTNGDADVYSWQPEGVGECRRAAGCLAIVSDGRRAGESLFLGSSAGGADAYFLTTASLVGADPGGRDVYDARVGGGFPEPETPLPCIADACQGAPFVPEAPSVGTTLFPGRNGNAPPPPVRRCARKRAGKATGQHRACKRTEGKGGRGQGKRGGAKAGRGGVR